MLVLSGKIWLGLSRLTKMVCLCIFGHFFTNRLSGGFPDHVPTPVAPRPDNVTSDKGFLYDRLGVRVPTIVVSPWVKQGRVVLAEEADSDSADGEFEHSSLGSTTGNQGETQQKVVLGETIWIPV